MNNINQLKSQYSRDHPGFGSYLECMSRALLLGLSSFTIAFSTTYIPQSILRRSLTYGTGGRILTSSIVATSVSYYITSRQTKLCQAAWMALEEKHTYLSPISHPYETKLNKKKIDT